MVSHNPSLGRRLAILGCTVRFRFTCAAAQPPTSQTKQDFSAKCVYGYGDILPTLSQ